MRGKQNIITISKFFMFLFDSNDVSATSAFKKITVTSDRSNNSGGLGAEPPTAGGQRGFGGEAPNAAAIFQFFSKNKAFLCIFWSKLLLFLNDCKVCYCCAENTVTAFPKNNAFLSLFCRNFCLKTFFK